MQKEQVFVTLLLKKSDVRIPSDIIDMLIKGFYPAPAPAPAGAPIPAAAPVPTGVPAPAGATGPVITLEDYEDADESDEDAGDDDPAPNA